MVNGELLSATSNVHHCHAKNCQVEIKPELLMCFKHWRQVPKVIQQAVWKHYRPGQCDDKNPSKQWHQAADAAIVYVAWKNGRQLSIAEQQLLTSFGVRV